MQNISQIAAFTKVITIISFGSILASCAVSPQKLAPKDYANSIQQELREITLWSGKYVGLENDCFPPINKRLCKRIDKPIFQKIEKLDMEIFNYSLKFDSSGIDSNIADESMLLRAAKTALKRGYKYITPLASTLSAHCTTDNKTTINGNFFGNYFSGQSSTSQTTRCTGSTEQEYLLFNDVSALQQGVYQQQTSGQFASEDIGVLISLYYGTIPNLNQPKSISTPTHQYIRSWPHKSWENYRDASNVVNSIDGKY